MIRGFGLTCCIRRPLCVAGAWLKWKGARGGVVGLHLTWVPHAGGYLLAYRQLAASGGRGLPAGRIYLRQVG